MNLDKRECCSYRWSCVEWWRPSRRGAIGEILPEYIQLALQLNARSIVFPNISTGIYRFPKEKAADIAIQEVTRSVREHAVLNERIHEWRLGGIMNA
ncbi:macro domain-containing protein [Paenibacillus polymyxa]|uniref:macro domain-containing protein n=1 Tax=Paenibacillus polymyxa TaxID=1406 RepID=UPI002AB456C3|nr:macro domain-containing protein [Paenibacillus polymyxa]MDY8045529.1 macro domain-containing protein [Paenibacillus polymyxa]